MNMITHGMCINQDQHEKTITEILKYMPIKESNEKTILRVDYQEKEVIN